MFAARRAAYGRETDHMEQPTATTDLVRSPDAQECIETFEWRDLHFHVVTADPLTADQVKTLGGHSPRSSESASSPRSSR